MSFNNNDDEEDLSSFMFNKSNSLKKQKDSIPQSDDKQEFENFLQKNKEIIDSQSAKKNRKKQPKTGKKKGNSLESNNGYKSGVAEEECDYLFNLLKDGNSGKITETTLRLALNSAGMTDIDDDFVIVIF